MLRSRYLPSGLALIALVFLLQVTPVWAAQNPNPGVLPPESHPFGKTYGQWMVTNRLVGSLPTPTSITNEFLPGRGI